MRAPNRVGAELDDAALLHGKVGEMSRRSLAGRSMARIQAHEIAVGNMRGELGKAERKARAIVGIQGR